MRVIKAADRIGGDSEPPKGKFHGHAMQSTLHHTAKETRASFVRFEPGAHTHWHEHSGGQVLHIIDGVARVQAWGGDVASVSAGDTVIAPPGEKHWHGAGEGGPMTQLALTSGEVTWLEEADSAS
ncbi:MAG TPA: cupin domain-containing protein [Candidatus Dormibacteraeota bacterium]|nr:cupin domain-containing protein [Candidatus Dormibacteraeota bacterium]